MTLKTKQNFPKISLIFFITFELKKIVFELHFEDFSYFELE